MKIIDNKWFGRIFLSICWCVLILFAIPFLFLATYLIALFIIEIQSI